jgi:hypothetical protein
MVDGDPLYDPPHGSFYKTPSIAGIYDALEAAYEAKDDQEVRDRAVAFAAPYDVDRVMTDYWLPALDALDRPREIAPLLPNRAVRRAARKQAAA